MPRKNSSAGTSRVPPDLLCNSTAASLATSAAGTSAVGNACATLPHRVPRLRICVVETAASEAHVEMQARYDARNPAALKQLVSTGTKLRAFSNDMLSTAFKHSMDLYGELSAKNEDWKKIYADYAKFRADQNLWFRFTEATFDRFMQSQKL